MYFLSKCYMSCYTDCLVYCHHYAIIKSDIQTGSQQYWVITLHLWYPSKIIFNTI